MLVLSSMLTVTVIRAALPVKGRPAKAKITAMTKEQKTLRAEEIKQRMIEINAMDKSMLTNTERKDLHREARNLKKEARIFGKHGMLISIALVVAVIILLVVLI